MTALVIAAHPDDEVLGCGGTMARLAQDGTTVHVLILATGLTSRTDFDPVRDASKLALHEERARRAGALVGVHEVRLAGLPDQRLDQMALLDITRIIEDEVRRLRPTLVFTQNGGDLNLDHVIAFRATLTATRPMAGGTVRSLYSYEVPSSSEWAFGQFEPRFQPDTFFDISAQLDAKIAAMTVYESEARPFPHPRSPEAIRALAQIRGASVGVAAAEAFRCIRRIL